MGDLLSPRERVYIESSIWRLDKTEKIKPHARILIEVSRQHIRFAVKRANDQKLGEIKLQRVSPILQSASFPNLFDGIREDPDA